MKIYIINPDYGMSRELMNKELSILSKYVGPDDELAMDCLTETVVEINSLEDAIKAAPEVFQMATRAQENGFDAAILYCFSDPGYELCKDGLTMHVYGCARSSIGYAAEHFQGNIGVILTDIEREGEKRAFISSLGLDEQRFVFEAVDLTGISYWDNRSIVYERLLEVCHRLVKKDVACIILGCTAFIGLSDVLSEATGTVVLDPAVCALREAESTGV